MTELLTNPQTWTALITLTVMEVILGIDNIIFISVLSSRLPEAQRPKARRIGLTLAVVTRLGLLGLIVWLTKLVTPLFTAFGLDFSMRELILLGGGLFLIAKSTFEIHKELEWKDDKKADVKHSTMGSVIFQILVLDLVFSLDSIITAIGMANSVAVMVAAIVIAVAFMLWAAGPVSDFVHRHPTVKMLALSFLLLIGVALVAEGLHQKIPKGYIYFAMGFSFFVELLNMRLISKTRREAKQTRRASEGA